MCTDMNMIYRYDMVKRKQYEPVIIKKGQHAHISHTYYHPSTSERFWYGKEGEKFAEVKNMDGSIFAVKASRYNSSCTSVDMGQIPGLLYKFA